MRAVEKPTLSNKILWTALLLVLGLGYLLAVIQIIVTTGVTPGAILEHFRGDGEMIQAMDLDRLVMLSHVHLLGMPLIVFPAAWIFSQSQFGERFKATLIGAAFLGIVLDVGSWWGLRYVGGMMVAPLILGGALLGVSFASMTLLSLMTIWRTKS